MSKSFRIDINLIVTPVKSAKKDHVCEMCEGTIKTGSPYFNVAKEERPVGGWRPRVTGSYKACEPCFKGKFPTP